MGFFADVGPLQVFVSSHVNRIINLSVNQAILLENLELST